MPYNITQELFDQVKRAVSLVCERSLANDKLVLTEADLESRIYAELLHSQIPTVDDGSVHIHAQMNFLKPNGSLGWKPDIAIIPDSHYTVSPNGELTYRKGYTHWGSSIALELKLLRTNHRTSGILKGVIGDIKKLSRIRDTHYGEVDPTHTFMGASVILCRQVLPDNCVHMIQETGSRLSIPVWIFNSPDN